MCTPLRELSARRKSIQETNPTDKFAELRGRPEQALAHRHHRVPHSSYQGEISEAPENLVKRDFHADSPNELWLTDITEFRIPAGRVRLSPIIDCFDGMAVNWRMSTSPNAELANSMPGAACSTLCEGERPRINSNRGCHYRWPGWIKICDENGLERSMSKNGCSPDNSACEGFFGRLKNEVFYGEDWSGWSIEEFMSEIDAYIRWHDERRIKLTLDGMSPVEYRESLGLMAAWEVRKTSAPPSS